MLSYFNAAVNGRWLSDIDESVYVIDAKEQAKEQAEIAERVMMSGSRFIRETRKSLSVIVSFYILESDPQKRMAVLQFVQEWALGGGKIEVDYRPGQFLNAVCKSPPLLSSANEWREKLSITFTAYEFPYWIDLSPTTVATTGKSQMKPSGQYSKSPCDVIVTNSGKTEITTLSVQAGDTEITFAGIYLPAGDKLEITHDSSGIFAAKIGEESILAKRTDASSDDLVVEGSKINDISVSSDGDVSAVFKAWGVYL